MDNVGRGYSSCPGRPHTPALFVEQLLGGLRSLGISEAVHIVGISMGGAIAAQLAVSRPQQVKSLTFVCSAGLGVEVPSVVQLPFLPELLALFRLSEIACGPPSELGYKDYHCPAALAMVKSYELRLAEPSEYALLARSLVSTLRNFPLGGMRAVFEAVGGTSIPTLLIWGDEDKTCPYSSGQELQALLRTRMATIPGAGHCVFSEFAEDVGQYAADHIADSAMKVSDLLPPIAATTNARNRQEAMSHKARIAEISANKLLARIFTVIDSNANGNLTKQELQNSPVGKALLPHFEELNMGPLDKVSFLEWSRIFTTIKASQGREMFHEFVVQLAHEAGIDRINIPTHTKRSA